VPARCRTVRLPGAAIANGAGEVMTRRHYTQTCCGHRAVRYAVLAGLTLASLGMRPAGVPPAAGGHRGSDVTIMPPYGADSVNEPVTLDWRAMAELNYRTGEMPESLRKLHGATVRVPGFMVPLEDWEQQVIEFILVPYFGACIHVPPPPPNQMAHVLMAGNRKVQVNLWDPVWVVGTLKIEDVDSPYGTVGYQIAAQRILPYEG
jgi:uncharacterized protein